MKQCKKDIFLFLVFAAAAVCACGNTTEDDGDTGGGGDSDRDDSEGDAGDDTGSEADSALSCTALAFDMKDPASSGQVFITLSDMQVHYEDITDYDLVFARVSGQGPTGYLGNGVTAVNAGNEIPFESFNEAPGEGYAADDTEPVIGSSWNDGGSGQEGFDANGNVYVLKLADGTYAKIAVTGAKNGKATADAYHQPDGSSDLNCELE
jgi:hypothetical protein